LSAAQPASGAKAAPVKRRRRVSRRLRGMEMKIAAELVLQKYKGGEREKG
jgi:hypothetical protein